MGPHTKFYLVTSKKKNNNKKLLWTIKVFFTLFTKNCLTPTPQFKKKINKKILKQFHVNGDTIRISRGIQCPPYAGF